MIVLVLVLIGMPVDAINILMTNSSNGLVYDKVVAILNIIPMLINIAFMIFWGTLITLFFSRHPSVQEIKN